MYFMERSTSGCCRRYPPVLVERVFGSGWPIYPVTTEEAWCGEWAQGERVEEPMKKKTKKQGSTGY